ncbi:MAG TPA: vWA domain-containing protein [Gaiellales bacterium]
MSARIPLAGARELVPAWRRTRILRVLLALVLVALVVLTAIGSSRPTTHPLRFLPHASTGIVVLDLSASISSDTFDRIGTTLDELAATNGRYGLVVFSDVAYEALPPGTPSSELLPFARYFKVRVPTSPGMAPDFTANPWTNSFSAGTKISSGLGLAFQIIREQRIAHPGVILISDLDDDPGDRQPIEDILGAYRHEGLALHVVSLNAAPNDLRRFRTLVGGSPITQAHLPGDHVATTTSALPLVLVLAALALALALALDELYAARLTWSAEA